MHRLFNRTRFFSLAALMGSALLWTAPVAAETLEAELHPADPGSGRLSSRAIGYLRFTPGNSADLVNILVHIQNLTIVASEEPLMTQGGHATYRHGMRIRAAGSCDDLTPTDSQAGVLPDVGVRQNGNALLSIQAKGINMGELPGKSVVMYRGSNDEKRQIVACGVIKKD